MAIDGRINVDVLFHDTDGTTSLKVVSLEDSTAYTTGKVAIVTGTCGTTEVSVSISPGTYRDASGAIVNFTSVSRFAFAATPGGIASKRAMMPKSCHETGNSQSPRLYSRAPMTSLFIPSLAPLPTRWSSTEHD
jgi:hypothetical protein